MFAEVIVSVIADSDLVKLEEGKAGRTKKGNRGKRRGEGREGWGYTSQGSCSIGQVVLVGIAPLVCARVSEFSLVLKSFLLFIYFFIFFPRCSRKVDPHVVLRCPLP